MIFDIIFLVFATILAGLGVFFEIVFSFVFPSFIDSVVQIWVQSALSLNMFLPMIADPTNGNGIYATIGILDLISWFVGILMLFYGVKLVLWLLQIIPFFSPPRDLPGASNTVDLSGEGNRINLRSGPMRSRSRRNRNTRGVK